MKKALVLGGGGSKGAYELGVWRALDELDEHFDIVCGTSIGAMIGAMYVQQQYDRCMELWEDLGVEDIIAGGVNLDLDIELLMAQKGKYKQLLKSYVKHKGADISPFIAKLETYFDAQRFFTSPIDYACMCVNVSKRRPQAFSRKEMNAQTALDCIIASASCFPAFPMKEIQGDLYVDGGYFDNVPIRLARSMGAEDIVAVDLKAVGKRQIHHPEPHLLYIEPQVSLGSFLLFDKERIQRNMALGYQDTMKKYQRYLGSIYTFPFIDQTKIQHFEDMVHRGMDDIDALMDRRYMHRLVKKVVQHRMVACFSMCKEFDWPFLRLLEMAALIMEVEDVGIWDFSAFVKETLHRVDTYESSYQRYCHDDLRLTKAMGTLKEEPRKDMLCSIYHYMCQQGSAKRKELEALAVVMNDTFVMAYLLYTLAKENS